MCPACVCRWVCHKKDLPLLFPVYWSLNGFPTSSGVLENDFGLASLNLTPVRNRTATPIFEAQTICHANFGEVCTDLEKVPIKASIKEVQAEVNSHTQQEQ